MYSIFHLVRVEKIVYSSVMAILAPQNWSQKGYDINDHFM